MRHLKLSPFIGVLLVSVVCTLATVALPQVKQRQELSSVWEGRPFPFIHQDFSGIDPPSFPLKVSFASPWEYGISFHLGNFLMSLLFFFIVVGMVVLSARLLLKARYLNK